MKGTATIAQQMMVQFVAPIAPAVPSQSSCKLEPANTMYKIGAPSKIQALKKKHTQPPITPKQLVAISL
jgi:hypothetical protein